MIRGIGIDAVSVRELAQLMERIGPRASRRIFTEAEWEDAAKSPHRAEYLAARLAAKEAVFKALAPLTPAGGFDLRRVETRHRPDGSPYIRLTADLKRVVDLAGVGRLHISITTEQDMAIALVVAE